MKYIWSIILVLMIAFVTGNGFAQPPGKGRGPRSERLEQFKKMRLIEALKLNEEESVRFFARQSAHEDKARELMKNRNESLDQLEEKTRDKADANVIKKLTDEVLKVDEQIFTERQRYQEEQRRALTMEQFAKFLVFERDFGRQVRDAFGEMYRDRRRNEREE